MPLDVCVPCVVECQRMHEFPMTMAAGGWKDGPNWLNLKSVQQLCVAAQLKLARQLLYNNNLTCDWCRR